MGPGDYAAWRNRAGDDGVEFGAEEAVYAACELYDSVPRCR